MALASDRSAAAWPAELVAFVSSVRVGPVMAVVGADAYVPILAAEGATTPDALLLDEALAAGTTVLREVDEGGDVNRVLVTHLGARPLLLVDGEQIVGAKQNRVFNASFLVAPASHDLPVHVSCVERGRWRYEAARGAAPGSFSGAETTLTGVARSKKLSRTTKSMITGSGYDSDQRAVWADVDDYLERSRVISRTSCYEDGVASRRAHTTAGVTQLTPVPRQLGVALVRRDRLVLMDLFGGPDLYVRGYRKIALGMLADGAEGTADPEAAARAVADALAALGRLEATRCGAPGLGETLAGEGAGLTFAALVHGGAVYHVVVGAA
jgi:hypothetical protein